MARPKYLASPEQLIQLGTAQEVIDKLGGVAVVQLITGCKHRTSISNWLSWGYFPSRFYKAMITALEAEGYTASPLMWDQRGKTAA